MPKYQKARPFDIVRDIMLLQKQVKGLIITAPVSQRYTYTPIWSAATTNPNLGNGTITGLYRRVNGLVCATINLTIGSTTTLGSGRWNFSLPYPVTSNGAYAAPAMAQHGGSTYVSTAILNAGVSNFILQIGQAAGNWDSTHPFAWANGDSGIITLTYETDN